MISRSTSARVKPPSSISWWIHTAYSSPVRRGSVAMRQRALISSPSTRAATTLVFPASMASSMAAS